jgi:WD40 repeat protein
VSKNADDLRTVTCGDDKLVCVWDTRAMQLVGRFKMQSAALCCDVDPGGELIAVGLSSSAVSLLVIENSVAGTVVLSECGFRKDCKEQVSDVKFSGSGEFLAVGSHDNSVYVYACVESTPAPKKGDRGEVLRAKRQFSLRPVHRLRGHSGYITHLDWSRDENLLKSTCGAYELLVWDIVSGRLATGTVEADTKWNTHTCVLGFSVMGIWPKYSDGTDINAISVSQKKKIIATADDFGAMSLFNFPCVVSAAPKRAYNGHRYHTNICIWFTYLVSFMCFV